MPGLSITNWIGFVADIIGIVGAIFAVGAWWQARQIKNELDVEKKRQQKTIRIVLSHGDEKIELPVPLLRAELTRQEVLGRIGMIPMKKQNDRYSIRYINTVEFWEQLTQVMEGAGEGIITIPLKEGELDQFDLKR